MCPGQQGPWISTGLVPMTPCGNIGHGHHHRPPVQQEYGPRYVLSSISGLIPPWPQWQHRPPRSVWARWQQDTGTPIWFKVAVQTLGICSPPEATVAMDIHPAPKYCWATIPDMAHGNNPHPEDIRASCGSTALRHQQNDIVMAPGHSGRHGDGSTVALRHKHGFRGWPIPTQPHDLELV